MRRFFNMPPQLFRIFLLAVGIVVVKLVGGTDSFVRRPFLYTGFWYGFIGGLMSLVLVTAGLLAIAGPIHELVRLYRSDFEFQGLGAGTGLLLLWFSSILGLAGAWFAVSRHLDDIQPR